MLTKKDIHDVLGEFFETILGPYLDREHKENQKEHEELGAKIDLINEHLQDHKKRISKLEEVANIL